MAKPRQHNEWFFPISKKKCPTCGKKTDTVTSWCEYRIAKKRLIKHFCSWCVVAEVIEPLKAHADPCGCTINLCGSVPQFVKEAWDGANMGCDTSRMAVS